MDAAGAPPASEKSESKSSNELATVSAIESESDTYTRGEPSAVEGVVAVLGSVSPAGASINTMLPHLGQARICPIAAGSRTFSRARQVVHAIEKGSTE